MGLPRMRLWDLSKPSVSPVVLLVRVLMPFTLVSLSILLDLLMILTLSPSLRSRRSRTDDWLCSMFGFYSQAIVTGEGPVANWKAHIADPSGVNGFTEVFAT